MGQRLVHLLLVEKPFFGLERAGVEHADLLAIGPIDAEDANVTSGKSEVEKSGLNREPRGVGQ